MCCLLLFPQLCPQVPSAPTDKASYVLSNLKAVYHCLFIAVATHTSPGTCRASSNHLQVRLCGSGATGGRPRAECSRLDIYMRVLAGCSMWVPYTMTPPHCCDLCCAAGCVLWCTFCPHHPKLAELGGVWRHLCLCKVRVVRAAVCSSCVSWAKQG